MQGWQRADSNLCSVDWECINNHTQCFSTKSCALVANCCLMRGDYLSPEWIDNNARAEEHLDLSISRFRSLSVEFWLSMIAAFVTDLSLAARTWQDGPGDVSLEISLEIESGQFGSAKESKSCLACCPFAREMHQTKLPKLSFYNEQYYNLKSFFLFSTQCACQKFKCTKIAETWVGSEFVLLKEFYMTGH